MYIAKKNCGKLYSTIPFLIFSKDNLLENNCQKINIFESQDGMHRLKAMLQRIKERNLGHFCILREGNCC